MKILTKSTSNGQVTYQANDFVSLILTVLDNNPVLTVDMKDDIIGYANEESKGIGAKDCRFGQVNEGLYVAPFFKDEFLVIEIDEDITLKRVVKEKTSYEKIKALYDENFGGKE